MRNETGEWAAADDKGLNCAVREAHTYGEKPLIIEKGAAAFINMVPLPRDIKVAAFSHIIYSKQLKAARKTPGKPHR